MRQASGRMSAATEASQKATAWLGTNEVMDRVAAARRVGSSSARGTRTSSFAWTPSWPGPAHTKGSERLSRANAPNRTRTILSVPLEPTRHQASDSAQPTVPRSEEDSLGLALSPRLVAYMYALSKDRSLMPRLGRPRAR